MSGIRRVNQNRINDLTLVSFSKLKDISGLGGHHHRNTLDIGDVTGYDSLYNIPHINFTDISILRNARTVALFGFCDLKDVVHW